MIDIRFMKKRGYLQTGAFGTLTWRCRGKKTGSVGFRVFGGDHMVLNYRHQANGGPWEDIQQVIRFDRTACNYGGYRFWFLCPQCNSRVGLLHGAGRLFLYRSCYRLTYASQQENKAARLFRRAWRIRGRLGDSSPLLGFPDRPKGMHNRTYARLMDQFFTHEINALRAADMILGKAEGEAANVNITIS